MNSSNINVYQIYYDENQKQQMFLDTKPIFNKDLDIYFENRLILNLFTGGKIVGDYFGLLSHIARIKNNIKSKYISELIDGNYDIYSFTYDKHDVLGYANKCHPDFLNIFTGILNYLNIDVNTRPLVGIYQNAIITAPNIYLDYIQKYLVPAIEYLENCSDEIKDKLYSDSMYDGGDKEYIRETFGIDFYTYHTFLLERLWSLYYHVNRRKISISYLATKLSLKAYKPIKVYSKGKLHKFNLQ